MSETPPLDEKRPWLTDPDELPSRMNWLTVLFFPWGRSPKLHFTRAWTLLLLPRLIFYLGLLGVGALADVGALFGAVFPVLLFEGLMFVAHARRLNDAGRSTFLAWAVFAPAIVAIGLGIAMVPGAVTAHEAAVVEFNAEKAANENNEPGAAPRDVTPAPQAGGRRRGGRRGRGGGGFAGADAGPPEQVPFIMEKAAGPAAGIWVLGAILLNIWSLVWVARQPRKQDEHSAL